MMNISLDQARVLEAVAETGSFSRAAKKLGKSHSAIAYSIRMIEEQTQIEIFDKSQYRSTLTIHGAKVLEACRRLLDAERELASVCKNINAGWEPHLKIVHEGLLPISPLVEAVRQLGESEVPTKVQVVTEYNIGVERTFEELEAHLMTSLFEPRRDVYDSVPLTPVRSLLVAGRGHPLTEGDPERSLEELKRHRFITVLGVDPRLDLSTSSLDRDSSFQVGDFHGKKDVLLAGMGFGWMPEYLIHRELQTGEFKLVRWNRESERVFFPHLYHPRGDRLGRAGRAFVAAYKALQKIPDCSQCLAPSTAVEATLDF